MTYWCLATDTPLQTEGGGGGPAPQEAQLRLSLSAPSLYAMHPLYALCRKGELWLSCQMAGSPCCHKCRHSCPLGALPGCMQGWAGAGAEAHLWQPPHVVDAVRTGAKKLLHVCSQEGKRCTGQTAPLSLAASEANIGTIILENREGLTAAGHHLDEGLHSSQSHNAFNEV